MLKKVLCVLLIALPGCVTDVGDPTESDEPGQVSQELPKENGGGYTCTVEQCNGNLNPFGHCTESHNGVCVECSAGGHVGRCSGSLSCPETNCPPVPPVKKL